MSENKTYTNEEILEYLRDRYVSIDIVEELASMLNQDLGSVLKPKFTSMSDVFNAQKTAIPQPAPKQGTTRILDLVVSDLQKRAEDGKAKYGTYLQANNGREALIDAYQEALDLCMYLRQLIEEVSSDKKNDM